jgi:GNAT superfamily N-acetyltransferase
MIRTATEQDFDQILDMSARFWLETQFSEPFERDHTVNMVQMAYDHGLLAVVEIDGLCVGFCAGVKSFILGSTKALCATELAWWLNPEHRSGKNGVALLLFMEQLVKEQGIKYWTMISMQSSMPEVVGRMYEKLGYVHSETCYTKVFNYGGDNNGRSGCGSGAILSQ